MTVPFFSFTAMHSAIREPMLAACARVYDSNWFILGQELQQFEAAYAKFSETEYCLGVANGLDAIIIALQALGIKPEDEVIVPSNTYIATWLAVSHLGAKIVPVEPNLVTYNIDPTLIEAAITAKTKAIIPVHLYGQACEMDQIMKLAKQYKLFVVEDNAQAQGAVCGGQRTGSFGEINATSFYPGKNLGALGDAGAITTSNQEYFRQASKIRNYGSEKKYYNEVRGMNSRLDEFQAAMLAVKLERLAAWNAERQQIAAKYQQLLASNSKLILPKIAEQVSSVFHQYVIRTEQRDQLQEFLHQAGVGTLIHYPVPPHLQQAYSELKYAKGDFPIAEEIANTCLSLPIYPGLSDADLEEVASRINAF